jgi:hypothetical protein
MMHLIKLAAGAGSLQDVAEFQGRLLKRRGEVTHVTRRKPRQAAEVLAGGSLYWVVNRAIQARQPVLDLRDVTGPDGHTHCAIVLQPGLIRVAYTPKKPFQGWRYLKPADAPPDLHRPETGDAPPELVEELAELGLL